jgi:hypothetical protein
MTSERPPRGRSSEKKKKTPPTVKPLYPPFRLVFLAVFAITLVSIGVSIYVAAYLEPTKDTELLLEGCMTTWKMGVGASLGLLGGKSIK